MGLNARFHVGATGTIQRVATVTIAAVAILLGACANAAPAESAPAVHIGAMYFTFGVGAFRPDTNPALVNADGQFPAVALGLGYRATRNFAWEAEFIDSYQKFDTPAALPPPSSGNWDSRSSIHTQGLLATLKYVFPHDRVEPYAGAGIGWYRSNFYATNTSPSNSDTHASDSDDFGVHITAGIDYYVAPEHAFGLEYRRHWVDTHFEKAGLPNKLHAGGNYLLLRYRVAF